MWLSSLLIFHFNFNSMCVSFQLISFLKWKSAVYGVTLLSMSPNSNSDPVNVFFTKLGTNVIPFTFNLY